MKLKTNILIYRDSRSWGQIPSNAKVERYDRTIRWPQLLSTHLSKQANVIEECLPGRTLGMLEEGQRAYRNGLEVFKSIYPSHLPIQYVILDLGTNDLKKSCNQTASDLYNNIKLYHDYLMNFGWKIATNPQLIYLLPTKPGLDLEIFDSRSTVLFELKNLCNKDNSFTTIPCSSFSPNSRPSKNSDGVHLDKSQHFVYSWFFKEYFEKLLK